MLTLFMLDYLLIIILLLYLNYKIYIFYFYNLQERTWILSLSRIFIIFSYLLLLLLFFFLNFLKLGMHVNIKKLYINFLQLIYNFFIEFKLYISFLLILKLIVLMFIFILLLLLIILVLLLYIKYIKISFQSLHYFLYFTNFNYKIFCDYIYNLFIYIDLFYRYNIYLKNKLYVISIELFFKYILYLPIIIIYGIFFYELITNNYILYHYYYFIIWMPLLIFLLNLIQFYTITKTEYIKEDLIIYSLYKISDLSENELDDLFQCKFIKNIKKII